MLARCLFNNWVREPQLSDVKHHDTPRQSQCGASQFVSNLVPRELIVERIEERHGLLAHRRALACHGWTKTPGREWFTVSTTSAIEGTPDARAKRSAPPLLAACDPQRTCGRAPGCNREGYNSLPLAAYSPGLTEFIAL